MKGILDLIKQNPETTQKQMQEETVGLRLGRETAVEAVNHPSD